MGLDVLSERGRKAVEDARVGLSYVGRQYVETPQETSADIDGFFLSRDGRSISAAFEAKAREMSFQQLRGNFGNEWILTFSKMERGAAIARALCVPFVGVCYLIPDEVTLVITIANAAGEIVADYRVKETRTQDNCNGGSVIRENAFIKMDRARIYRRADFIW